MHAPDRLVRIRNPLAQRAHEVAVELGHRIPHRIGNVQRGGPLFDHRFQHPAQKVDIAAVAVLGAELDVGAQVAGKAHRLARLLEHLLGRHAQLFLHVQRRSGNERVDARTRRAAQGLGGPGNVAIIGARQRTHGGVLDRVRDGLHRLEVAIGRSCEASLDHVDLQPLELAGDTQLFVARHRCAGGLFAVAQGGVEDDQFVSRHVSLLVWVWVWVDPQLVLSGRKTKGPLRVAYGPWNRVRVRYRFRPAGSSRATGSERWIPMPKNIAQPLRAASDAAPAPPAHGSRC